MSNKTLAVDFDGVISHYTRWKGKGVFESPVKGCSSFLKKLRSCGWKIIIFTTRSEISDIRIYLKENKIPYDYINFNPENKKQKLSPNKILADVYLDDRAIRFNGHWDKKLFKLIMHTEIWWKTKKKLS